jgi:hypothetical protein
MNTTLPTDSGERKNYPLFSGCLRYFPAALAGVANTSKLGNDKHNPGQEMHHARSKSGDHGDCIIRHLIDLEDMTAAMNRGENVTKENILTEVSSMVWRALALSQELHEKFGSPLAPGAKTNKETLAIVPEEKEMADLKSLVKFPVGEVVKHINNDVEVSVQGTYFDANLKPFLFVRDDAGKIFAVDPNFYRSVYADGAKSESN